MPPNIVSGLRVAVLVSIGRHPSSGRSRRAEQDARALELGLAIAPTALEVVHAGNPSSDALRDYAGMGVESLRVLEQDAGSDAVAALSEYLNVEFPDLILTGVRAESGEGSGMLPFLLGEKLGLPVVTRIAEITSVGEEYAELLQALPRGQRRAVRVRLPFIASVDMAASAPRQSAYGPAQRAGINSEDRGIHLLDEARAAWSEAPARKLPKRLKVVKAKTAADRFKAATAKSTGDGGRVMSNESAQEKAKAIFDLLLEEGVIQP